MLIFLSIYQTILTIYKHKIQKTLLFSKIYNIINLRKQKRFDIITIETP